MWKGDDPLLRVPLEERSVQLEIFAWFWSKKKNRTFMEYELSKLPIDVKYEFCKQTGLEWEEHEKKFW
jgi:hypothetical protein